MKAKALSRNVVHFFLSVKSLALVVVAAMVGTLHRPNVNAQELQLSSCQAEILRVASLLVSSYGVVIRETRRTKARDATNPFPDSDELMFVLDVGFNIPSPREKQYTQKALDFMNSPQVRLRLASEIMSKCDQISIVQFGIANSGYIEPTFKMPNVAPMNGVSVPCKGSVGLEWGLYESC